MTTRPIVILGGMGPQASAELHKRILQKSRPHHNGNGDDFPYIVHFSLPIPDFISDESSKHRAITLLRDLAPTIEQLNPSCIVLACNTAHLLKEHVGYLQGDAFISLVETVVDHISAAQTIKVGLLASPTTVRTRLYEHALMAKNIAVVLPDIAEQAGIEDVIRNVIGMRSNGTDTQHLHTVASRLVKQNAQAILLGCTELPLVYDKNRLPIPVFDCLDLYADVIVRRWIRLHR